jgi:amino acid adenylation domain-containing protein
MNLAELLAHLAREGLKLNASDNRLRVFGPVESISKEVRKEIERHKESLLQYLSRQKQSPLATSMSSLTSHETYSPSFGQSRLLFVDALYPYSPAYNVSSALRFHGKLDVSRLLEAAHRVVDRHSGLRTYFIDKDGETIASVASTFRPELPFVDLSQAVDRDGSYHERCRLIGAYGFDLRELPLWRWELIKLGERDHALALAIHHTIADGWSLGLAIRELSHAYQALSKGEEPEFGPLPTSYAEFSEWQRQWMKKDVGTSQVLYWREKVRDFLQPLQLPIDRPRPPIQSDRGRNQTFFLGRELDDTLRRFASERGISLPVLIMTAFAALLYRYTQQERFLLGTAISNRPRAEFHDVFGFFVNWLPITADFTSVPNFDEMLENIHRSALEAFEHQDLPFDHLVRELDLPRDLSRHPLFQTMVVFHVPAKKIRFGDLDCRLDRFSSHSAKMDLTLFVTDPKGALPIEGGDSLFLEFEYSTELFDDSTIKLLAENFTVLLSALIKHRTVKIDQVPLENSQLATLSIESETNESSVDKRVEFLFDAQVALAGDAVAIIYGDQQWTYRQLDEKANAFAAWLRNEGVQVGDHIGICLENTPELIAGLLGVIIAGAAYVPLDPCYPQERLSFMIEDSGVKLILGSRNTESRITDVKTRWLNIEDLPNISREINEASSCNNLESDSTIYVIYTSGTTGLPKGVIVSHSSVVNFILWLNRWLGTRPDDRILFKTPISFDASVREFLAPLIAGATVVLAKSWHGDADELNREIASQQITVFHGVPSLYLAMLRTDTFDGRTLCNVVCGGETLTRETVSLHLRKTTAVLHNLYGPTEATVDALAWKCTQMNNPRGAIVPIGRPIANAKVYILDRALNPVPPGIVGEIYLGGIPLARGYWNRPDLTRERFVPNPFAKQVGEKLYRTGDLGSFLPDGNVVFQSRIDRQVNVRGNRIELQELEATLHKHPKIALCIACIQTNAANEELIVAFVNLKTESTWPTNCAEEQKFVAELRQFSSKWLPRFMVPSRILPLSDVPKLPNGKINYKALSQAPLLSTGTSGQSPSTDVERAIIEVFKEVLELDVLGIEDNFFNLGGHSLIATQAVSRLRSRLSVDISVSDIFQSLTIAELAETLSGRHSNNVRSEAIRPAPRPVTKDEH